MWGVIKTTCIHLYLLNFGIWNGNQLYFHTSSLFSRKLDFEIFNGFSHVLTRPAAHFSVRPPCHVQCDYRHGRGVNNRWLTESHPDMIWQGHELFFAFLPLLYQKKYLKKISKTT